MEQKAKFQQQEEATKSAEKTRLDAPNCSTEKKFRHLYRTKNNNNNKYRIIIYRTTDGRTTDSRINDVSPTGFLR